MEDEEKETLRLNQLKQASSFTWALRTRYPSTVDPSGLWA